jgi:phosphoserine phosphatase RsbU/P
VLKQFIKEKLASEPPGASLDWLEQFLEFRAKESDQKLEKNLLKELVLKYSEAEQKLIKLNQKLTEKQRRIDQDLTVAAGIQQTLLPRKRHRSDWVDVEWKFIPCGHIGGDIFNVYPLDEDHLAFYMIDVSGHGVPSALVTVSVAQTLQPDSGYVLKKASSGRSAHEIVSPGEVLNTLDELYPLERFDMFFTIVYGVVNLKKKSLAYGRAGHPPPVLLHPRGEWELFNVGGPIIGMGGILFEEEEKSIEPGDKLIIYTDGIIEYENAGGDFFGMKGLCDVLQELGNRTIGITLDTIVESLMAYGDQAPPEDDVSLLGFEFKG